MADSSIIHPYQNTAEETMAHYDLTPREQSLAWKRIGRMGCPFFDRNVYMRTHYECAAIVRERNHG